MRDKYDAQLTQIIKHYGQDKQIDMAIEEMSELIKALLKYRRANQLYKPTARENIIDELADVYVMCRQMELIFNTGNEVPDRAEYKIERQIQRMKGEKL